MSGATWSFVNAAGILAGHTWSGPASQLAANTPAGHTAIAGQHDPARVRVDMATGQLVAYQPPAPPADDLRTWAWDAAAWAWVSVPTPAARQRAGDRALQSALDAGAQAWGYDSIISAASYAASSTQQFAAEAAALMAWRDQVWLWAGQTPYPHTVDELIAAMPAQPPRPTLPE